MLSLDHLSVSESQIRRPRRSSRHHHHGHHGHKHASKSRRSRDGKKKKKHSSRHGRSHRRRRRVKSFQHASVADLHAHAIVNEQRAEEEEADVEVCAVCLDDARMDCKLSPCNHVFHSECISQWVRRNFSCPLCRTEIKQFIPMSPPGAKKNKVMREFEALWLDHYVVKPRDAAAAAAASDGSLSSSSLSPKGGGGSVKCIDSFELKLDSDDTSCVSSLELEFESAPVQSDESATPLQSPLEHERTEQLVAAEEQVQEQEQDFAIEVEIAIPEAAPAPEKMKKKQQLLWTQIWTHVLCQAAQSMSSVQDSGDTRGLVDAAVDAISKEEQPAQPAPKPAEAEQDNGLIFGTAAARTGRVDYLDQSGDYLTFFDEDAMEEDENEAETVPGVHAADMRSDYEKVRDHAWLNARAGLVAGCAATIGTCAANASVLYRNSGGASMQTMIKRGMVGRALIAPVAFETVPTIGAFFMTYEHLKRYFCASDIESQVEKSVSRAFGERFVCAGIAGTVASATIGTKNPFVGLRFAAFFGGFELFKDLRSRQLGGPSAARDLNVCEVAGAATVGGLTASALYYPATQVVKNMARLSVQGQTFVLDTAAAGATGGLATSAVVAKGLRQVAENPAMLYRGFARHVFTFLPSCVACSCAFEFARRHFDDD